MSHLATDTARTSLPNSKSPWLAASLPFPSAWARGAFFPSAPRASTRGRWVPRQPEPLLPPPCRPLREAGVRTFRLSGSHRFDGFRRASRWTDGCIQTRARARRTRRAIALARDSSRRLGLDRCRFGDRLIHGQRLRCQLLQKLGPLSKPLDRPLPTLGDSLPSNAEVTA